MTRLHRFWVRNTRCRTTSHELDWLMVQMTGTRQCRHCERLMPQLVGHMSPDLGD